MTERAFPTFGRGEQRDQLLAAFRLGLRGLTNPDTGEPFTDDEVALATAPRSRWYAEANALDLVLLAEQQRALWLADQLDPRRASTAWLEGMHGPLWVGSRLPATGSSGPVDAPAAPGTTFLGSTTVPDSNAHYAVDPATGLRFQVLFTETTPGGGIASLVLAGIDTGTVTNLAAGSKLTWAKGPLAAADGPTVTADLAGGLEAETDADYARRIAERIRYRQAAGNRAHVRAWAVDASNGVEAAFVYACAYHAGSVHVAITQKRGATRGPYGRITTAGTLAAVTVYLVPPGSPVMPAPPFVVVTGCYPVASDLVLQLALPRGRAAGWADLSPWPTAAPAAVTAVTDPTHVTVSAPAALPAGVTAPRLMAWDVALSRFEVLAVQSVTSAGGGHYSVTLAAAPTKALVVGDVISPETARAEPVATTVEAYFDSLGPGELVADDDPRAHRASRFPSTSDAYPTRAGTSVLTYLADALGAALADAVLASCSVSAPPLPTDLAEGPRLLVPGRVGIYPL